MIALGQPRVRGPKSFVLRHSVWSSPTLHQSSAAVAERPAPWPLAWPCHRFAARRRCRGQVRRRGFRRLFPAIPPPIVDFIRSTICCVAGLSVWSTSLQRCVSDVFDDLSAGVAVLLKKARRRCKGHARPTFTIRQSKRRVGWSSAVLGRDAVGPRQCLAERSARWSGGRGATCRRRTGGAPAAGRRRHAGGGKAAAAASAWQHAVSVQHNIAQRPGRRSHRERQTSIPRQDSAVRPSVFIEVWPIDWAGGPWQCTAKVLPRDFAEAIYDETPMPCRRLYTDHLLHLSWCSLLADLLARLQGLDFR